MPSRRSAEPIFLLNGPRCGPRSVRASASPRCSARARSSTPRWSGCDSPRRRSAWTSSPTASGDPPLAVGEARRIRPRLLHVRRGFRLSLRADALGAIRMITPDARSASRRGLRERQRRSSGATAAEQVAALRAPLLSARGVGRKAHAPALGPDALDRLRGGVAPRTLHPGIGRRVAIGLAASRRVPRRAAADRYAGSEAAVNRNPPSVRSARTPFPSRVSPRRSAAASP